MIKKMCLNVVLMTAMLSASFFSYGDPEWIDVRTKVEHMMDSIEGDTRISYGEIVEQVSALYPDKETEIKLYCRSGNRAGKAMAELKKAGYNRVTNEGSIADARQMRGIK